MIGKSRRCRRPSSILRIGEALALIYIAVVPALRAESPEINRISPMAARPGETVKVTLQGKNLLEPQQLWTSFGARIEWEAQAAGKNGKITKPDGKRIVGKLTLAADAPLGLGFLRLPTATGLSGPLFFLVDELPVVAKNPENASAEKAQTVTAPAAIEGATEAGRSDFYRVEMKAGESISVEAFAARIGSKMDPVLRLLDEKGQELASVDDTLGLAGDCRLRHRAIADGPLIVEIRDASFTGGSESFYHLRIGDFPLVSAVFPPVAAPGGTVEVQAQGEAVQGVAPLRVTAQKSATGIESTPIRFGPGKPAAFAYVRTDDSPLYIEKAANDTGTALTVLAPCTVLGGLHEAGDRNTFFIATKKGERVTLTPLTRNIGSPAVLYLGVEDEKGAFVASNDNPGNTAINDAALTFVAPVDGACRVSVEDIAHRGGSTFVYGIHVETSTQGFELTASADRFVAPRGGSFSVKITAQRRGLNGPITLELVSADARPLPPGFHCEQNIIEKGKNDTLLKVAAPADVPSGSLYHVRIVGHSLENGAQFDAVAAQPKSDPKKAPKDPTIVDLGSMPQPPRLLCETFPICVGPDAPDFFAIELTGGVDLPAIVCKNSFVLRQKAIDPGYAGEAQLRFEGLPPGVAITSGVGRGGRIKGQVDFICEVTGPVDIALGVHAFDIVASGELKGAQKEVRLAKVPLRIVKPLAISGAVASPIAPGEKQKLKITTTRYDSEDPQPIDVSFLHFPTGISGPERVTIAPADSESVVELAVAPGTGAGTFDTMVLAAATRVKGMDVTVESSPIHLEVGK